jgi:hypothetical protein
MVSIGATHPGFGPTVTMQDVARILDLMSRQPGTRETPIPGDITGDFDQWFDGGALRFVTGSTEFSFVDGTTATTAVVPFVNAHIRFPGGVIVTISQNR